MLARKEVDTFTCTYMHRYLCKFTSNQHLFRLNEGMNDILTVSVANGI